MSTRPILFRNASIRILAIAILFPLILNPSLLRAESSDRPNVVLIVTDDQGYGDMSCHGNPWLQTPEIDRLYRSSVRLTDYHVDPTCSPTRAALMSGRYSTRVGVWLTYSSRHHLRKDELCLAEAFRRNGYRTGIFGKWHLGDNYPYRPQDRGFEESLVHGGGVVGETPDHWGNDYYDDVYLRNGAPERVAATAPTFGSARPADSSTTIKRNRFSPTSRPTRRMVRCTFPSDTASPIKARRISRRAGRFSTA